MADRRFAHGAFEEYSLCRGRGCHSQFISVRAHPALIFRVACNRHGSSGEQEAQQAFTIMDSDEDILQLMQEARENISDGKFTKAERLIKKAIALFTKDPDSELQSVEFIDMVLELAALHQARERFEKAEPLYVQALNLMEQSDDFPKNRICSTMNKLSVMNLQCGKTAQARDLLDRALLIAEEWLERVDCETMDIMNNLARVHYKLGAKTRAKNIAERLLRSQEAVFGSRHGEVAETLELLATINQAARRFDFSESQYRKALSIKEGLHGSQHEDVARLLRKLASLHYDKHDHTLAKPLLKKSLAIRKTTSNLQDEELACIFQQLADVYYAECNYIPAELYFKKALNLRKKLLGEHSLEVADTLCGLGKLECVTKKFTQAESHLNLALEIQIDMLGPYNKEVAATLAKLSGVYMAQGRFSEANLMNEQAMACQVQHMQLNVDDNDPYDRAVVYHSQGAYKEAEEYYNKALAKVERSLGTDHFHLAEILTKLAELNRSLEKFDKAESLLLQALKIFERMNHRAVLTVYATLADLYQYEERYDEAELLLKQALSIMENATAVRQSDQIAIMGGYERLLQSTGRKSEAEKMRTRLKNILKRSRLNQSLTKKKADTR